MLTSGSSISLQRKLMGRYQVLASQTEYALRSLRSWQSTCSVVARDWYWVNYWMTMRWFKFLSPWFVLISMVLSTESIQELATQGLKMTSTFWIALFSVLEMIKSMISMRLSQTSFGHISINSPSILTVSMSTESPWKDLSIDTSHVSKWSIMAEILGRSTGNPHGTVY